MLNLLREGGAGAFAALAVGVLGVIIGVVALVSAVAKSKGAFGLGVGALLLAVAAAGVGIAGTVFGLQQIEAALRHVDNAVLLEQLRAQGFKEASSASLVGFFAALTPLVCGLIATLAGARTRQAPMRRQGLDAQVASTDDERSGRVVMALVFIGLASLVTAGAWVFAHRAPPASRFDFPQEDGEAWLLARAIDDVERRRPGSCFDLEHALAAFFDTSSFPRKVVRAMPASLSAWRAAADACATMAVASLSAPPEPPVAREGTRWSVAGLADSPMLHDAALRDRLLATRVPEPSPAPPESSSLSRDQVRAAVQKVKGRVQACYERALLGDPMLAGKVLVQFTIEPNGRVRSVEDLADPPMTNAEMIRCVLKAVRAAEFPPTSDGDSVTVNYPFVFTTAK